MEFNIDIIKKFNFSNKDSYRNDLVKAEKFLKLKQSIGENWFFEIYNENNLESESWKKAEFNFSASNIQISNDSLNILIFSWSGTTIDGILNPGETIQFNQLERKKIYLKMNGSMRIWAY